MIHGRFRYLLDEGEWSRVVMDIPHDVAHTWHYCRAIDATTGNTTRLLVYEGPQGRAVCPLAERSFGGYIDVVTPPGFTGFTGTGRLPGLSEAWRAFALDRGYVCGYLGVHPILPDPGAAQCDEYRRYNDVYVLDLAQSVECLISALDRNRRRQLREWKADGAPVVTDRPALIAFLIEEYPRLIDRRGGAPAAYRSPDTLRRLCESPNAILVGMADAEGVNAVVLVGATRQLGTALVQVATDRGRGNYAPLVWTAILQLRARGVRWMNLGGGVRSGDSVATAKLRFGATSVPLSGVRQVFRPDVFRDLCRRATAVDDDPYFPPYQRPAVASSSQP